MLAKLALRNVRRSVRDYAVYFVTLPVRRGGVLRVQLHRAARPVLFDLEAPTSASTFELTASSSWACSPWSSPACWVSWSSTRTASSSVGASRSSAPTCSWACGRGRSRPSCSWRRCCVGCDLVGRGPGAGLSGFPKALSFFTAGLFNIPMHAATSFIFSPDAFSQTLRVLRAHLRGGGAVQHAVHQALQAYRPARSAQPQRALPRAQPLDQPCGLRGGRRGVGLGLRARSSRTAWCMFDGPSSAKATVAHAGGDVFVLLVGGRASSSPSSSARAGRVLQGPRHVHRCAR